jgi:small ligand-binding sensory domain FIST
MQESARECRKALGGVPDFTIMFPCLSRGPLFFGGSDKDLAAARESFPGTPIIGFYGNGEIAPLDEHSHLHQYSTVLAAFHSHDA